MLVVTCPMCDKKYERRGFYGHLRFVHELKGERLSEVYESCIEDGQKEQRREDRFREKQRPLEESSELHAEFREVTMLLEHLDSDDEESSLSCSKQSADKLRQFYKARLEQLGDEIDALLTGEVLPKKDKGKSERAWDEP